MLFIKLSAEVGETALPLCRRWRWGAGFILLVVNATAIDIIACATTTILRLYYNLTTTATTKLYYITTTTAIIQHSYATPL